MTTRLAILAIPAVLTFCTSRVLTPHAPDPDPLEWRKKVTDAKGLEDPAQKSEAMLVLVREALPGRDVRLSGVNHTKEVHPDDNEPAPVINFDPRLNQKTSVQLRPGSRTSLQNNFGYYFSFRGNGYMVLGPAALDPRSPVFTRLAAEHELFHALNHIGDPRPLADRELETWTQMFATFFHQVYQFKQQWAPMLRYYEEAATEEQKAAIDRLVAYYDAAESDVRVAFQQWLARRKAAKPSSKLVNDLENEINKS